MRRALALALVASLAGSGCAALVQHPAPTIGLVAGAIGFGTCEMDQVGTGTCGIVGGSAAVFLGGITALVYLLTDQPPPQMEGEEAPDERIDRHHAPILLPPSETPPTGSGSADSASASGSGSGSASGSGSGSDSPPVPVPVPLPLPGTISPSPSPSPAPSAPSSPP